MKVTYKSKNYAPEKVAFRYICKCIGSDEYKWCEVDRVSKYDLRQGTVSAQDVPGHIREKLTAIDTWPPYVLWPQSDIEITFEPKKEDKQT